jgi:hypothetical protein
MPEPSSVAAHAAEIIMTDNKTTLETIEDKIKSAAQAVEDFADKVAAPEEPVVLIPDTNAPPPTKP